MTIFKAHFLPLKILSVFALLFIIIRVAINAQPTQYQFTEFQVQDSKITWVSKVSGDTECDRLGLYKRNMNNTWTVLDSYCIDGAEQLSPFIEADYNAWFKGRFLETPHAHPYLHFKKGAEDNLLYFSDESQDERLLDSIRQRLTKLYSNLNVIVPYQPQAA